MTRWLPAEQQKEVLQHLRVAPSSCEKWDTAQEQESCRADAAPAATRSSTSCQGTNPSAHPQPGPLDRDKHLPWSSIILENTTKHAGFTQSQHKPSSPHIPLQGAALFLPKHQPQSPPRALLPSPLRFPFPITCTSCQDEQQLCHRLISALQSRVNAARGTHRVCRIPGGTPQFGVPMTVLLAKPLPHFPPAHGQHTHAPCGTVKPSPTNPLTWALPK